MLPSYIELRSYDYSHFEGLAWQLLFAIIEQLTTGGKGRIHMIQSASTPSPMAGASALRLQVCHRERRFPNRT